MHRAGAVLVAGLEDLLPFAFVVIWIVAQVVNLFRRAARPAEPRPEPVREPADFDVEELLRRSLGGGSVPQPPPLPKDSDKQPRPKRSRRQESASGDRGKKAVPSASGGDVARHVREAFAHDLAHASPQQDAGTPVAAPPTPAATLVAALRSPAGIRQALILRELLERPVGRW